MAYNNNNPQKGSEPNQPDKKQSIDSHTSIVDSMIMPDHSKRIGGYEEQKKEIKNSTTTVSPQFDNDQSDDDLEDLEWLRSLGLDEPIEILSSKMNSVSSSRNSDTANSDWLIVSDIKTTVDSSENTKSSSRSQDTNPSNQSFQISEDNRFNELDKLLDEDLGLYSLGFDGEVDFAELSSFVFDNSENISSNELQNDLDISEDKIQKPPELLEDSFDVNNTSSNDWDNDFGGMEQSSEWSKFSESFAEQITDSDFDDDFNNYETKSVETIDSGNSEKNNKVVSQDTGNYENAANFNDLESIIDEDFDLDDFDEEDLPVSLLNDTSNNNFSTTLTPNRAILDLTPATKNLTSDITHPPLSDYKNSLISPDLLTRDPFEEALTNDLQNNELIDEYDLEVNLHEEALASDLLNGDMSDSEVLNHIPERENFLSPPPQTPLILPLSENFNMDANGHDFLDDFDLDSLDTQLTGDDFGSAFLPPAISTGLTPPSLPIAPLPQSMNTQDVLAPAVNNPPPPFLPPLPPRRNPAQAKPPSVAPSIQNKSASKPMGSTDEGWSELLDTVLSDVLRSPTDGTPYSEPRESRPFHIAGRTGDSAENNIGTNPARQSQGRECDYKAFNPPNKKDTGLPDFNDLGLEIHDDSTDWSLLLDSKDLSDSITSISKRSQSTSRTPPLASRSELMGISETREISRDHRKSISGFDATQARMAAISDQIDFSRFTEDKYSYEPPSIPPEVAAPVKKSPKISISSVSLESLWLDYLKIPVIGLGVFGGAFILYSLLNRPVFDVGLRWGIFKDASGKDFTNADFKGAKLNNVDFSKATLTGAKMQNASLVGANFTNANLDGVNFTNANLNRARLIQSSVVWAEFNKAQMNLADFEGADLTLSNFANAKMEGTNLLKTKIGAQGTDKATKFSSTMLLAWQIVNEQREGRNLAEKDLSGLNLSFTSLKRANLSNAKLNYADLTGTDLSGANLTGSQVNGANWNGAKLAGVNLADVNFDQSKLPKTDEETICPNGKKGPCKF